MTGVREPVMEALFELLINAYPFKQTSRRLLLWDQVPATSQPALFLAEHDEGHFRQSQNLAKREFRARAFIYLRAPKGAGSFGAKPLNQILDAVEAALAPSGQDVAYGVQRLGGLVSSCFIDGEILKDPGDLDEQALAIVPIRILLP